ncbi:MAG: ORF6N domain-containing protein [Candidatus Delongbacteria bacterium]|nr:ORF6N domain-containing protein [Candidatus Delongbacteria bacterium]
MSNNEIEKFDENIIRDRIYSIRGFQVMLDRDLAELYGVETKVLNQAVKRNKERFPIHYCFRLTQSEKDEVVTNCDHLSKLRFSYNLPYAFTEQGVAMLASILTSETAIIKGTGIPTIKRSLELNGSPSPKYDTDGDQRRFFVTEIRIHPDFTKQDKQKSNQDKKESIKDLINSANIQVKDKVLHRMTVVLVFCMEARSKKEIFEKINLSNQHKNFTDNIQPLIETGLLRMTIPEKVNSRNQKYATTEKGLIIIRDNL